MEQKIKEKVDLVRSNRIYRLVTGILFPVAILAFCFIKVNQGMDITDSTYSLTNFSDKIELDGMWLFSTFYANVLGRLMFKMGFGKSLLLMNVATSCVKAALALASYFFFTYAVKTARELNFLGTIIAVGLCWCPTTILYNYLTYLFFGLGAVFLYLGLVREKKRYLVFAGFFLGSNLFVRLPNVCEAALIIAVWFYSAIKKEKFKVCLTKTLFCIGGYVAAFIPAFVLISLYGGVGKYIDGIKELFVMGSQTSGYSVIDQVKQSAEAYAFGWGCTEIVILMALMALLIFLVLPTKLTWLRYAASTVSTGMFGIALYKKRGLFDSNYFSYGAIYKIGIVVLTIVLIWFVTSVFFNNVTKEEKLLAVISIVIIIITPLGSNNGLYTNLNNMFFVLPSFLFLLVRFTGNNEHFRGIRYSIVLLLAAFTFQSVLFGKCFVFRDGTDQIPRDTEVYNAEVVKGMKTNFVRAGHMQGMFDFWKEESLAGTQLLLYGDVSGLGFYLESPIAISTAWPSLPSFSEEKFSTEMKELEGRIEQKGASAPVVILGTNEINGVLEEPTDKKQEILNKFLADFDYSLSYSNEEFSIYISNK